MIHTRTSAFAGLCLGLAAAACTESKAPEPPTTAGTLTVTSSALQAGKPIPAAYACTDYEHLGKSPPLGWSKGPAGTAAYAVTVVDPDANDFVHWALVDVPPAITSLPEGAATPEGATALPNDFGKPGYGGPCPPVGATHHYVFTVTALRAKVGASKADAAFLQQLAQNALATGSITVTFQRTK